MGWSLQPHDTVTKWHSESLFNTDKYRTITYSQFISQRIFKLHCCHYAHMFLKAHVKLYAMSHEGSEHTKGRPLLHKKRIKWGRPPIPRASCRTKRTQARSHASQANQRRICRRRPWAQRRHSNNIKSDCFLTIPLSFFCGRFLVLSCPEHFFILSTSVYAMLEWDSSWLSEFNTFLYSHVCQVTHCWTLGMHDWGLSIGLSTDWLPPVIHSSSV